MGQVLALGQTYPQLSSSNNFLNLQQNLADTEDKLAFARQYYNDAVATVNRLTTTIPWMFVAGMAGVKQREFYQVPKRGMRSFSPVPRSRPCRRCGG